MAHQIWVIIDGNGKIQHIWESPHLAHPDYPDRPPIVMRKSLEDTEDYLPPNWQRFKVPEPSDFKNIKKAANKKKKSISKHIFDEYEIDLKTKKLKKKKMVE